MMNGFIRSALLAVLLVCSACSTNAPVEQAGSSDEFADFDAAPSPSPEEGVEAEIANQGAPPAAAPPAQDEFSQFETPAATEAPPEQAVTEVPPAVDQGPDIVEAPAPEPVPETTIAEEPPPPVEAPAPEAPLDSGAPVNITNIQYRANDNGGTVVIEANGPMNFNPRMNSDTRQFIIEIPNSKLPRKLKRPFNTRDFAGTIGSIDAYQGAKSTTTRIVVQLRPGAPEPVVQAEGNSLFVVAQPAGATSVAEAESEEPAPEELSSGILSSKSLEEFLSTNQKFYGKKISIQLDGAELRDVFRLISDEANVNLVLADDVSGKISLKLKGVPWDQALVMIMKSKKLGYTRSGNVLRIAALADIRAEEEDSLKMTNAKKAIADLRIKNISVNYAKVEDLEKQLKSILSPRGSVVADSRTSSLVVTDIDENLARAEKLVQVLDIPPQQVLIEGKVVEATDEFERSLGVNWSNTGMPSQVSGAYSSFGGLRSSVSSSISPSMRQGSTLGLNFSLGTLDILGELSASLSLFERQALVKVISSPRVVTLHNEPAEISETTEIPLITSTVSGSVVTPNVTFKPVRLRLAVTPQITNDGAIILGVDVNRETAGAVVDEKTQARPVNSRSAKTKVIVKSSQTAVIGGIYRNDVTEGEQRVPGLGSLPVVGWLFKTNQKTKSRLELLIFLTPRILGQLESTSVNHSNGGSGTGEF